MIMKIGRYEFDINNKDVILDNGACYQLITRDVGQWLKEHSPRVSETQMKKLIKDNVISLYKEVNSGKTSNGTDIILKYYKFNIESEDK